ncbi:MAG: VanZ family protein [Spirochaetota bacterium]
MGRLKAVVLTVTLVGVFIVSVVPVQEYPGVSEADKLEHFLSYLVICFLFYINGFGAGRSFLYAVGYGVLLECVQYIVPYRCFSFSDMAANTLGAGLFAGLVWVKNRVVQW